MRGFTLIELLTVIAIIIFISSALFFQGARQRAGTEVKNAAYGLALQLRELQAEALGVRGKSGDFSGRVGMNFFLEVDDQKDDREYVTFVDADDDFRYTPAADTLLDTLALPARVRIREINRLGSGQDPATVTPGGESNGVTVVFVRPVPDATISLVQAAAAYPWTGAEIVLESTLDNTVAAKVVVKDAGVIYVE